MSFPYHDHNWVEVGDFLEARVHDGQRVLAPDLFWWRLPRSIDRWVTTNLHEGTTYDWVVCHKGELAQFPRRFLEFVAESMRPVFANDVFVVWAADGASPALDAGAVHLRSFHDMVAALPDTPALPNAYEADLILADAPILVRYSDLDDVELRAAENDFFRTGGYQYVTARDRGYFADIRDHLTSALRRWHGLRVLDVACGEFSLGDLPQGTTVTRIDFAIECLRRTLQADQDQPGSAHAVMDAHWLGVRTGAFHAVVFMDAIEHVRDASAVIDEIARVLRPRGELLVSYANRNSLNQLLMRKLGYPEFVTNHHHLREFAPAELTSELDRAGFDVLETAGVGFYPYWGVPGIDEVVRPLTDDDPEVVEYLREVGRRAGAEYAYAGVVIAQKRDQTSSGSANKSV